MKLLQINQSNFRAGKVHLCNVNKKTMYSYDAIKKFAEEKGMDVFIIKNKVSKPIFDDNMYTVIATSDETIKHNICGISYAIPNLKASFEEISVKVFNAVFKSIENLEKKLKITQ